jgi:hypothetical protein
MKQFRMIYCLYDPGNYFGHRQRTIEAETFEEAEQAGWKWLEGLAGKGKWEYSITPIEAYSSFRVYDTKLNKRL